MEFRYPGRCPGLIFSAPLARRRDRFFQQKKLQRGGFWGDLQG
jgi:hypothetical protein